MHVSPSQISTYRSCARKWAWDKIEGIPRPGNRFAALGSEVHELLEGWLLRGELPDTNTKAGAIAASGLNELPHPPVAADHVERAFAFEIDGVKYVGKIDLFHSRDGVEVIHDHKTTSGLKWAKTPAVLLTDEQAIIYGFEALRHTDEPAVWGEWLYMETGDKRRTRLVRVLLERAHVEEQMALIHITAKEMIAHRAAKTPALSLLPTVETCAAYGGCAYQENCALSSTDRMTALMKNHSLKTEVEENMGMSLADKMKARGAAAPTPAAAPVAAPVAVPVAAPVAAPVNPPARAAAAPAATASDVDAIGARLNSAESVIVLVMSPAQLRELVLK